VGKLSETTRHGSLGGIEEIVRRNGNGWESKKTQGREEMFSFSDTILGRALAGINMNYREFNKGEDAEKKFEEKQRRVFL